MLVVAQLPGHLPVLIGLLIGLMRVMQRHELSAASRRLGRLDSARCCSANLLGRFAWPLLRSRVYSATMPAAQVSTAFALLSVPLALLDTVVLVMRALAIMRRAR